MSETGSNENPVVTDSQETHYDETQNINNSQMFNESQDFALVIGEDSDESTKNQFEAVQSTRDYQASENPAEKNVVEAETQVVDEGLMNSEIEKETQHILTQVDKTKEDELVESSKFGDNTEDSKFREKRGSDEDEIIQGTPPEISSPSRKSLSGKRRGESLDEPPAKIQRTVSDKDNKLIPSDSAVREKETQSDILCDNTEGLATSENIETHVTRVIIEETQEPDDSEPMLFDNTSDNDDEEVKDKSEESEQKNKTASDLGELNATNIKPKDGEKGDSEPSKEIVSETSNKAAVEATTNGKDDEVMDVTETDLAEKKISHEEELTERKDDGIHKVDKEFLDAKLPSSDSASDSNWGAGSNSSNKSRMSVELIYDRKSSSQEKKRCVDLVEIDEEGEKIVLDSSSVEGEEKGVLDSSNDEYQLRYSTGSLNNSPRNISAYKSCLDSKSNTESSYKSTEWHDVREHSDGIKTSHCQITNGEEDLPTSGTTKTVSGGSDMLVDDIVSDTINMGTSKTATNDLDMDERFNSNSKLNDTVELATTVSDSDGDSLLVNENVQNKSEDPANISRTSSAAPKTTAFERRTRFYVDLKYLVHVDDNTKEIVYKEVTDIQCEPIAELSSARRNSDLSGCLADISGNANKDTSPGSVLSNPQLFQLPASRLSIASTMSSSSSASSAASLAVKLFKDTNFSQPKGRAKHARRPAIDTVIEEKLSLSENFEKEMQGWKSGCLITDTILQSLNMFINSPDIFQHDNDPGKREDNVLSSTPEPSVTEEKELLSTPMPVQDGKVISQAVTPKSTKDKKPLKKTRTKTNKATRSNGKASPEVITTSQEDTLQLNRRTRVSVDTSQSDKFSKQSDKIVTPSRLRPETPKFGVLRSLTPQNLPSDELVGKIVFAKWPDNNYYLGKVTDKSKEKYKVDFYDGKSKLLSEAFIIPMPELLREGLSVYAITKDHFGSMGIILQSETVNNVIYYTIDLDNGNTITVETKDIFLKPGQAQILKEEVDMASKNLPKTPQHLGQVSLDNLVPGPRRSKQSGTPTASTPKSRRVISPKASRITDSIPASGSGIPKVKGKEKELSSSESETKSSDSNISSLEDVDGVQPELVIMPVPQISKGPSNRMKGRGRSKSKQTQDDAELGPIPPASSKIFKNMSFILTSTSSDIISRHQTDDSCSEAGTENEEEWLRIPFVKDRVKKQLINGGGTVYDTFKLIPKTEYKNTKLITNVPNLTAKSIQCLSVGIPIYNHNWVIQCCRENKALKPTAYELPAGWSLERKTYVESYDRRNKQPFTGMIIGMPVLDNKNAANRSIQFWRRICENAGAGVQIIDDPEIDFCHATAILTDNRCPSWLVEKADRWQIPLVSTVWIVQCIIAGELLIHDTNPQYKHTFIQS